MNLLGHLTFSDWKLILIGVRKSWPEFWIRLNYSQYCWNFNERVCCFLLLWRQLLYILLFFPRGGSPFDYVSSGVVVALCLAATDINRWGRLLGPNAKWYSINAIIPFRFTSPSPLSIPPTERPSLVSSRPQLVSTTPLTPIHVTSTPSYYFHTSTPDSYSYAFQVGPLFCAFCLKNLSSMLLLFHFDCNGQLRRLNVSVFF